MKQNSPTKLEELDIVYYSTLFLSGKMKEEEISKILGMDSSNALVKARDIIKAEANRQGVGCQEITAQFLKEKKRNLSLNHND